MNEERGNQPDPVIRRSKAVKKKRKKGPATIHIRQVSSQRYNPGNPIPSSSDHENSKICFLPLRASSKWNKSSGRDI